MGFLVGISELRGLLPTILLVLGLLFLGRAIFVYADRPIALALGRSDRRLPVSWLNVITFAGVRGAIPVVLALSLLSTPLPYPSSTVTTIVGVAIGVAFLSILIGNLVSELYVRARFAQEPPPAPAPNSVD
jgi:NhaP-type Na+/H+ or K+/H+ antiporter